MPTWCIYSCVNIFSNTNAYVRNPRAKFNVVTVRLLMERHGFGLFTSPCSNSSHSGHIFTGLTKSRINLGLYFNRPMFYTSSTFPRDQSDCQYSSYSVRNV